MNNFNNKAVRYVEDIRRDKDVSEQDKELKELLEKDRARMAKRFEIFWNT